MEVEVKAVAEMPATQLKALIRSAVKEVLQEIIRDPDGNLDSRSEFEERLHQAVALLQGNTCSLFRTEPVAEEM